MILSNIEWLSKIFNDTRHRTASLRLLSFLFIKFACLLADLAHVVNCYVSTRKGTSLDISFLVAILCLCDGDFHAGRLLRCHYRSHIDAVGRHRCTGLQASDLGSRASANEHDWVSVQKRHRQQYGSVYVDDLPAWSLLHWQPRTPPSRRRQVGSEIKFICLINLFYLPPTKVHVFARVRLFVS